MNSTDRTTEHALAPSDPAPAAWQEFRDRRDRSLAAPHGILAQVGLHWVDSGQAPRRVDGVPGSWELAGDQLTVTWQGEALELLAAAPEVEVTSQGDRHRASVRTSGDVRLARFGADVQIDVIRRGGRTGLRLLDPAAPRREAFAQVPTSPYDPALVLTGTWTARPAEVTVGSALPWLEQRLPSPGVASLEVAGESVELVLTGEADILFTDETSGSTSADWRVVRAELDGERITVDLNRAVNFPAAFSAWATCPRPPEGNHLAAPIRAGEQRVIRTER